MQLMLKREGALCALTLRDEADPNQYLDAAFPTQLRLCSMKTAFLILPLLALLGEELKFRLGAASQISSALVPRISAHIKEIRFCDSIVVIKKREHQRLPYSERETSPSKSSS